jgi:hypothetical protein
MKDERKQQGGAPGSEQRWERMDSLRSTCACPFYMPLPVPLGTRCEAETVHVLLPLQGTVLFYVAQPLAIKRHVTKRALLPKAPSRVGRHT